MNRVAWDRPETHRMLVGLTLCRARFRVSRVVRRLRSPRRLVATSLAILCFLFYLVNGVFVFSNRAPADPDRLRLWLSGGMVLYALYHAVRCAWSRKIVDLEMSGAERLWLGGGPIHRSTLAVYHLNNVVVAALLKTFLLVVLLARDAEYASLLFVGVLVSLLLLETVRLIIERGVAGMEGRGKRFARGATATVAGAVVTWILIRVASETPSGAPGWAYLINGFHAVGTLAATDSVQFFALPWLPAATLAVSESITAMTAASLGVSVALVPLSVIALVHVDRWSGRARERWERDRLRTRVDDRPSNAPRRANVRVVDRVVASALDRLPSRWSGAGALFARQVANVRRYAGTVLFSFAVPMALSLSPLATGQISQRWFFVVGGIAMCTMLLAPPALRIDFRRDLKRMLLLRSLPIRPLPMAAGQLTLPILITIAFQVATISIAWWVVRPATSQVVLWSGMLAALAVFTFALENALFLAYPHHERTEGVAMMVRAKLTFLGKVVLIAFSVAMLLSWATICGRYLSDRWATGAFVAGSLAGTWAMAIAGVAAVAWCWSRFDVAHDIPPE